MSRGFLLDVGDLSGLVMDSQIARALDDLIFRLFSGGKLGLLTPDGISPDTLCEIIGGRILEQARKGAGLRARADRENTGRLAFAAARVTSSGCAARILLRPAQQECRSVMWQRAQAGEHDSE